jgi:3D-(3,5/4)-trihydroxycyclohexane-1,2-dione acylhydrolase (decyclizing)
VFRSCSPDPVLQQVESFGDGTISANDCFFTKSRLVSLNVNSFDVTKARGISLPADARLGPGGALQDLTALAGRRAWTERAKTEGAAWRSTVHTITGRRDLAPGELPCDGEVIGDVQRSSPQSTANDIVVCAAGTSPPSCTSSGALRLPGVSHGIWLFMHGV